MTAQQQQGPADGDTGAEDAYEDDALEQDDAVDEDGVPAEAWTPPTREEWEASQAKLKRANEQAKRLREKSRTTPAAPATEAATPTDPAELTRWQTRAVRSAAKGELLARGADPDMVDLALGRLKANEIDFNGDDEPELDDWLDEMEDKYPKLFAKNAPAPAAPAAPRAGRLEQGAAATGRPVRPAMSLGEQIIANSEAARLRGQRGR